MILYEYKEVKLNREQKCKYQDIFQGLDSFGYYLQRNTWLPLEVRKQGAEIFYELQKLLYDIQMQANGIQSSATFKLWFKFLRQDLRNTLAEPERPEYTKEMRAPMVEAIKERLVKDKLAHKENPDNPFVDKEMRDKYHFAVREVPSKPETPKRVKNQPKGKIGGG
ncbi:MAG: hypothetical protein Q7S22_08230 [Candidatus Micrarchaeota archaeon]|nr:hypothetical protein [Candidatus Micrarchaeota archaeon]